MTRRAEKIAAPESPGAFRPDGSWNPEGQLVHRGALYQLIYALCRERKFARLTPAEASLAIQASSHVIAFPNWRQWDACPDWAAAWTSTSAEETVKRAGETIAGDHHWCGAGKWLPGSAGSCPDQSHREPADPKSSRRLLDEMLQGVGKAPSLPVAGTTPPETTPPPAPDEKWHGWGHRGGRP